MPNKPREKPAEDPTPGHPPRIPPEAIAASEAFRLRRDAERWRFFRTHLRLGRIIAFQRQEDVDAWIDQQMRRDR